MTQAPASRGKLTEQGSEEHVCEQHQYGAAHDSVGRRLADGNRAPLNRKAVIG